MAVDEKKKPPFSVPRVKDLLWQTDLDPLLGKTIRILLRNDNVAGPGVVTHVETSEFVYSGRSGEIRINRIEHIVLDNEPEAHIDAGRIARIEEVY
jgi:hypothetical protein